MASGSESRGDALAGVPLRCPHCLTALASSGGEVICAGCGHAFPGRYGGLEPLDLRPPVPIRVKADVVVGDSGPEDGSVPPLSMNSTEIGDPSALAKGHTTPELVSWIPPATRTDSLALDLGCGGGDSRRSIEEAGYRYVGIDYEDSRAPMFADAHRLPFDDDTFDFVMSVAVLEHLHTPTLAVSEVARVLRPGGQFLGTVAFLEPYHARSYFHHSALGVQHVLRSTGLAAQHVWSVGPDWTLFDAQEKVLFKGAPSRLKRLLTTVSRLPHELWWRLGRRHRPEAFSDEVRFATTAGAFGWLATAPTSSHTDHTK